MNANKPLGYGLLIIGLVVIILTAYQSYNIFTGKLAAPLMFKTSVLQKASTSVGADVQSEITATVNAKVEDQI